MPIDFSVKRRIEGQYARRLTQLFNFINRAITGLSVADAVKKIIQLTDAPEFTWLAESAVANMITMVKADNERTWRSAAKGSYVAKT